MDFKITIMLDATDRFQACIENLMRAAAATMAGAGRTKTAVAEEPKDEEEAAPEPPVTEEPPVAETPKTIYVADMRRAVEDARNRIEGEGWESKDTEGYRLYHKEVTAQVRRIVGAYGADKMPDIEEDRREAFIKEVNGLRLVDGKVTPEIPF